ncbi:MAG: hypothetical protein CEE38_17360 [Planctomycetes bacterium B3_Pla]|nr:MAG: hypothetical protein CEE38_17360 [Planctomycetes bacterium B3_Pla]
MIGLFGGRDVVIIGENDAGAGKTGMHTTFARLQGVCHSRTMIMPPEGIKDLRKWKAAGLIQEELLEYIDKNGTTVADEGCAGKLIYGKTDYSKLASVFIAGFGSRLLYHQDDWWKYGDGKYHRVDVGVLESRISRAFRGFERVSRRLTSKGKYVESIDPVLVDTRFKREVLSAIRDQVISGVAKDVLEPLLLDSGKPFDGSHTIMFKNGLLNVLENKLTPHRDNLFTTATLSYDYDTNATCPQWLATLDQWFDEDAERMALLQEWYGYNMIMTNHLEQLMFIYGQSGSGKTTAMRILQHLLDGNFQAADTRQLCVDQFGLASLIGKYAVIVSEEDKLTNRRGQSLLSVLKQITGNDAVSIRRMHKTAVNGHLFCKVSYYSNALPVLHDEMQTLFRRYNLLHFDHSFKDAPDGALYTHLAEERPGIAVWAIEGLNRLLANEGKFTLPEVSKAEIEEIKIEASPLKRIIETYCTFDDGEAFTSRKHLYSLYRAVCEREFVRCPISCQVFPRRCKEAVPKLAGLETQKHGGERGWRGLKLTRKAIEMDVR